MVRSGNGTVDINDALEIARYDVGSEYLENTDLVVKQAVKASIDINLRCSFLILSELGLQGIQGTDRITSNTD
ncbi:MAG: hypothetical protein GY795_00805 [Desulfobacterales bacterium]|nr:hypothetical protein [Desulfobacterales bacterium]